MDEMQPQWMKKILLRTKSGIYPKKVEKKNIKWFQNKSKGTTSHENLKFQRLKWMLAFF